MHKYKIMLDNKAVGEVISERKGLYITYSCQCDLPRGSMFSLWLRAGGEEMKLGILAPSDGSYTLTKSIPAKYIPQTAPEFILKGKDVKNNFYPIDLLQPFSRIDSLLTARWGQQNGEAGLYIEDITD